MSAPRPAEETRIHSRLLKCALEAEDARAYWRHVDPDAPRPQPIQAFERMWFGARSLGRIEVLMANFRARFDAFPPALAALHRWSGMPADIRRLICHWHLQLADPLYRAFTGAWLPERRGAYDPAITRDRTLGWVEEHAPARWTMTTRVQFASKLMSAAHAAGLVATNRDPRPLRYPRVPDAALGWLLHLLRGVNFAGGLHDNPYLASVGLDGGALFDRLRTLPDIDARRQGDVIDWHFTHPDLMAWAEATVLSEAEAA